MRLTIIRRLASAIDEAMRMSPPAAGVMWREVRAGGLVVDGQYIPAGCDVGCCIYAVHHNEDYFPESYSFKPERWIVSDSNPKETIELARSAFFPFSLGPRGCAGKTLAYTEISNTIAKTLLLMDFRIPEDDSINGIGAGRATSGGSGGRHRPGEFQLEDHMSSTHDGPFLQFRLRSI